MQSVVFIHTVIKSPVYIKMSHYYYYHNHHQRRQQRQLQQVRHQQRSCRYLLRPGLLLLMISILLLPLLSNGFTSCTPPPPKITAPSTTTINTNTMINSKRSIMPATATTTTATILYATSSNHEVDIAVWTIAFATSHIGMSAIRNTLIDKIGSIAEDLGLVGTSLRLPDIWPGDEAGQEIFPTCDIAGRQLYRIVYTIVSFATLGNGFIAYLNSLSEITTPSTTTMMMSGGENSLYYAVASLSWGISIASLINPSPLSLVPVFETKSTKDDNDSSFVTTTPTPITTATILRRNDSKKLQAYGLTRVTRHPLILPVVPWGIATAGIMGGNVHDYLFFGILSIYAILGCYAQDLRVIRQEGSVGTVFNPNQKEKVKANDVSSSSSLQDFFQETSFLPFGAILESRQSMKDVMNEVPWWAIVVGSIIGYQVQHAFVAFLVSFSSSQ